MAKRTAPDQTPRGWAPTARDAVLACAPMTSLIGALGMGGTGYLMGRPDVAACGAVVGGVGIYAERLQAREIRLRARRDRARFRAESQALLSTMEELRREIGAVREDMEERTRSHTAALELALRQVTELARADGDLAVVPVVPVPVAAPVAAPVAVPAPAVAPPAPVPATPVPALAAVPSPVPAAEPASVPAAKPAPALAAALEAALEAAPAPVRPAPAVLAAVRAPAPVAARAEAADLAVAPTSGVPSGPASGMSSEVASRAGVWVQEPRASRPGPVPARSGAHFFTSAVLDTGGIPLLDPGPMTRVGARTPAGAGPVADALVYAALARQEVDEATERLAHAELVPAGGGSLERDIGGDLVVIRRGRHVA